MGACCSLFITFQNKNAHYHLYCKFKFISGTLQRANVCWMSAESTQGRSFQVKRDTYIIFFMLYSCNIVQFNHILTQMYKLLCCNVIMTGCRSWLNFLTQKYFCPKVYWWTLDCSIIDCNVIWKKSCTLKKRQMCLRVYDLWTTH